MQQPPSRRPTGVDPLGLMLRSRAYEKQQDQRKQRILILFGFLLFAAIVGYGVYAFVNDAWPFETSAPGPSTITQPGTTNPGSVPGSSSPSSSNDPEFEWNTDPWGACSKDCGGGTQTRTITCRNQTTGTEANQTLCDPSRKPPTQQPCNEVDCQINRDCEYTEWTPWDNTNCEVPVSGAWPCKTRKGYQHRTRRIANRELGTGKVCDNSYCNLNEVRTCTVDADPPTCLQNRNSFGQQQECSYNPYLNCPPGMYDEYNNHETVHIKRDELSPWFDQKC